MGFLRNEEGQIGSLQVLVSVAITLMIIGSVFVVGPLVFDKMESTVQYSTNSTWNPETNADITGAKDIWSYSSLIGLVVLVALVSMAIFYLRQMGGGF